MVDITYGSATERGSVRKENQDSILCRTGIIEGSLAALFVIADGMGGLFHGATVSHYITGQFAVWWEKDFPQMLRAGYRESGNIKELLEQEVWDVNQFLLQFRQKEACHAGSTLSALLLYQDRYYIVNLGDSRIYRLRKKKLERLTVDQSLVAQLAREKGITEKEAEQFAGKNVLTMCVGMFPVPQNYYAAGFVEAGDSFLLCSDGFYNPLGEVCIRTILEETQITSQEKVEKLIEMISPGKATDNISAILAEIKREKNSWIYGLGKGIH